MFLVSSQNEGEEAPGVEAYAVRDLVARADAVQAGLGVLVGWLADLVGGLTGEGFAVASFDEIEQQVMGRGRELLRMVAQHVLDVQAVAEPRLAGVADAAGGARPWAERGHERTVVSGAGPVVVRRMAYRAAGQVNLHPRDAVLNLPPRRYSWAVQARAAGFALEASFAQAADWLAAATGTRVGKRQTGQITAEAARDAEGFLAARPPAPAAPGLPLVISVDGKGVAMRPEGRRRSRYQHVPGAFEKRLSTGEKRGAKRMAEVGVVFDALPPQRPRTPETIMGQARSPDGTPATAGQVRAAGRWYVTDITADRAVTIARVFDEAQRRDPGHQRTWVALADGDRHQIAAICKEAARRQITITVIIDFIHVLEYLWKVGWAFHPPRDPALEAWVTAQALEILHGRTGQVITLIRALAAEHPPTPGSEHAKLIRKTLTYLANKQPYLDYPRALENGWPIATGVIEGACRHLVHDRMGITGARWGLPGAEAILALRAIKANGDLDAYWAHHLAREHQRNHLSRYHPKLAPAA
jgi:hypothetical protein